MAEPRIDNHQRICQDKQIRLRPFLVAGIPCLLLLLTIGLSFFKGCTDLGRVSKENIYDPTRNVAEDEGFVGKSNRLLQTLLSITDSTVEATCLDSLNKRYPALEFALPYGEEHKEYIEASDLRLVAIHPEYIEEESLRRFYFNSRLPQLLQQQDEQKGETFFRFVCKGVKGKRRGTRPLEILSITVIPTMFKVALSKNPWTGTILGAENCLFSPRNAVFLSYGNAVLPLRDEQRLNRENPVFVHAIMSSGKLLMDQKDIDYYQYYQQVFQSDALHSVNIGLRQVPGEKDQAVFRVCYAHDSLLISHNMQITVVGNGRSKTFSKPVLGSDRPTVVPFQDGMKLLVYDQQSRKLGEFILQRHDPSNVLSCLVQSSTGTSRFTIAESQTDLFTQQMLRGLSRHLSNRDNIQEVRLSLDPLLSRELEKDVTGYLHQLISDINKQKPANQQKEQYDMSVTVMDMATGEVLASPFYTTLFDHDDFPEILRMTTRNSALSRRSIGSVFKPMTALAAVQTTPSLLDMDTQNPHRYMAPADWNERTPKVKFFERNTYAWAKKSASHWNGCDFTTFLSRSDDVYPVALTALAMTNEAIDGKTVTTLPLTGGKNLFETGKNDMLKFKSANDTHHTDVRDNYFTDWLSYLYNTSYENDDVTDLYLFDRLLKGTDIDAEQRSFGLEEVSPELTSLRMDRFYEGDDFKSRLVPWVLGQGDNLWNCIKVAEAWCRMIGKHDVRASFIRHLPTDTIPSLIREGAVYPSSTIGLRNIHDINQTWNIFLDKLHQAQSGGTLLSPMHRQVVSMNQDAHSHLMLFSKTGTPDAYLRYEFPLLGGNSRFVDVGMFTFALVDEQQYNRNIIPGRQGKGIVCVIRVTRSYECNRCRSGRQCAACEAFWGLKSEHARDFFASPGTHRLRKFYEMTKRFY